MVLRRLHRSVTPRVFDVDFRRRVTRSIVALTKACLSYKTLARGSTYMHGTSFAPQLYRELWDPLLYTFDAPHTYRIE